MGFMSLIARLSLNASGYMTGLKQAEGATKAFSRNVNHHIKGELAALFGVGAITVAAEKTIHWAKNIDELSARLGLSTEALQQWMYAAKLTGASAEDVTKFFEVLGTSRDKALGGDSKSMKSFERFGVTLKDLKTMRIQNIGAKIGEAYKTGDPQQLVGALRSIGGRGAGAMVAAFKEGLVDLLGKAPIVPDATIAALDELADAFENLGSIIRVPFANALAGLLNSIKTGVGAIQTKAAEVATYFRIAKIGGMGSGTKEGEVGWDQIFGKKVKGHEEAKTAAEEVGSDMVMDIVAEMVNHAAERAAKRAGLKGGGLGTPPDMFKLIQNPFETDPLAKIGGFSSTADAHRTLSLTERIVRATERTADGVDKLEGGDGLAP